MRGVRGSWKARFIAAALTAGTVLVAASASWFAGAGHLPVMDPQDTGGKLDIRRADVFGQERPRWKVATYGWWRPKGIWDRGFILVKLDTFGDERFDYYALVRSVGNRMRGDLYRDRRRKKDRRIARLNVWRKNRRSVSLRIPLQKLNIGPNRVHYSWAVQTLFTAKNCPRTCFDFTPDSGAVVEPLPGIDEPTPTPEPTPEPTPTK